MPKKWTLYSLLLCLVIPGIAAAQETLEQVRVHGNYKTPDEVVLSIAAIKIGDEITDEVIQQIRKRLLKSGRFAGVEIRKRYRSISGTGPVALIIVVEEKKALAKKFLYLPILSYTDEYGFTYGATVTALDLLGFEERITVPLSWGGTRQAGAILKLDSFAPVIDLFQVGIMRKQQENPHFEIRDTRTDVFLSAAKKIKWLYVEAHGRYTDVSFDQLEESFSSYGITLAWDTRQSVVMPYDAIYLGAGWDSTSIEDDGPSYEQYWFDLRAYKRVWGQAILAGQAYWKLANDPLPVYQKPFLGGATTLRGYETGEFIGDNIFLGSVELRLPLSPVTAIYRAGIHFFWDAGAVWDDGFSFDDSEKEYAAGVGGFAFIAGIGLKLDLAYDMEEDVRLHIGTGFRF